MQYITLSDLLQFVLVIIGIIGVVFTALEHKKN